MKYNVIQVAEMLGVTPKTVNFWYMWDRNFPSEHTKDIPKLPEYTQEHKRGARYWTNEQVEQLKEFQSYIKKGRGGFMGKLCRHKEEV